MFKRKQKVSYKATYHKPSFVSWIRYTRPAKTSLMATFLVMFGAVGYLMLQSSSALSCKGANITVNSSPDTGARYHIYLTTVGDAGSRNTPYCMESTANYRLVYESANNDSYQ